MLIVHKYRNSLATKTPAKNDLLKNPKKKICKRFLYETNRKLPKNRFRMAEHKTLKPTESELEILQVLWDKGNATVRDVHEKLLKTKDIGYTTTLKLMQIMHEKGLVKRDDRSRTHIYKAVPSRENTQKMLLNKFISNLFGGSSSQLVIQALGNASVNEDELEKIQELINELKKKD